MRRGIGLAVAALSVVWCALGAATVQAAPAVNGVYDLTGAPKYLTVGPDGNVWVVLSGSSLSNDVAKITPAGVVTEFDGAAFNNPIGIASDGTSLWVTQAGAVVEFSPADPVGTAAATPIADIVTAQSITLGPDGNLWTGAEDDVLRIPPAAPATYVKFNVPGMSARGIAAGDELIWLADALGGRVISFTTAGAPTPYDVGDSFGPQEVGATTATDQVAYGNDAPPQVVGRITPGGVPQPTPASGTDPFGVDYGADGAWWFAQFASDNLGRLTTAGVYTTLALPAASGPRYITAGPNNTLWVGLETSEKVARITGVDPPPAPPPPDEDAETTIDKAPETVKAGKKGAKAKFKFSSETVGATFECRLKRKGKRNDREKKLAEYAACDSPKTYKKLRRGRYTFAVRASAAGETDPSPATAKLRVKGP